MNRLKLPLASILVEDRQRIDYGDLTTLQDSLKTHGLIQPIVVNQVGRLLAGGRRLQAATNLGWTEIDVVYRETLSKDEEFILELEENIRRKDMHWGEQCLNIEKIHKLKIMTNALDSKTWGQRETGAMLGVSLGKINYNIVIAQKLKAELGPDNKPIEGAKFWTCDNLNAAWNLWMRDKEDAHLASIAEQARLNTNGITVEEETAKLLSEFESELPIAPGQDTTAIAMLRDKARSNYLSLSIEEARTLYESNPHNDKDLFHQYYTEKLAQVKSMQDTVNLSGILHNVDSIKFMNDNSGRFDHVITDIPYGIDMDMLNQQNIHGGMSDIDTVEELHDVEYNLKLIADFFPAAYRCTKEHAFVITWGDLMNWQFMYDCATKAGFAVQRWAIIWHKTQAMNQCINFNTTKDYEIAIVCRKKGTTLVQQPQTSIIETGRDDLCQRIGHPFAKPFEVWKFLVNTFTLKGQTILEPFSGRGSGVISMLHLERKVVGCELDVAHYNALLENVKQEYYLKLNPNFNFK